MKPLTAVVIPAFNEQETIYRVAKENKKVGQVFVMDDFSNDNTRNEAMRAGAIVYTNEYNMGYQNNLYHGIQLAKEHGFKYAVTVDGDGQHRVEDVIKLNEKLKKGFSLVIGKRNKFSRESEEYIAKISSRIFGISDPLCGLKGYDLDLIENFEFNSFDTVATNLAIYLKEKKIKYTEINIDIKDRISGSSVFGSNKTQDNYKMLQRFFNNLL